MSVCVAVYCTVYIYECMTMYLSRSFHTHIIIVTTKLLLSSLWLITGLNDDYFICFLQRRASIWLVVHSPLARLNPCGAASDAQG